MEERILKGFDPNKRKVLVPSTDPREVNIFRCQGCSAMNTDLSIKLFGECWNCGGHKVCGGAPNLFEWVLLKLWLDVLWFKILKKVRRKKEDKEWGIKV